MTDEFFPITEPVVALIGPTAIGKTKLSIDLAKRFNFEIISVDSMQVYKYMDIGTAKITTEEMEGIPHHLINVIPPDKNFDAVLFEQHAVKAIKEILLKGKRVLLTGGTGLYLKSLIEGLSQQLPTFPEIRAEIQEDLERYGSKELHKRLLAIDCISGKRIHPNDTHRVSRGLEIYYGTGKTWSILIEKHEQSKRPRFNKFLTIGLTCDRQLLYKRIGLRSKIMMAKGFEKEVVRLLDAGYNLKLKSMRSIGYSHMGKYLKGDWGREKMLETLTRDTRRYAKRQYTWFNKINDINWVEKGSMEKVSPLIGKLIKSAQQGLTEHS